MAQNDGSLSYHLYEELMEFVGTPNIVRLRRFFFDTINTLLSTKIDSVICSGSKAEGLNLPGSDLDVMFIYKQYLVYNSISDIPCKGNGFYLDTHKTSAGFVQIRLKKQIEQSHPFSVACAENGSVLENRMFKNLFSRGLPKSYTNLMEIVDVLVPTHGPCLSTCNGEYDFLNGLQCHSWPHIASNWISRPRNLQWPPTYLIQKILKEKVVLAPIGSKFGSTRDNPNEWRLSFSVAEIILIHSFNHTQLTCYAMLKLMLKEVIDKNPETEKLLCSYFVKTILFWVIEETGCAVWQPHILVQCFLACFKRLSYFVKSGQCPNFFVPQNNMFEGKVCGSAQEKLSILIDGLYAEGINMFLRSKTLGNYLELVYESGMPGALGGISANIKDVDKAIYPLLHHLHLLSQAQGLSIYKTLYLVTHERLSNLSKAICVLHLANACQSVCIYTQYNMHNRNKHLYLQFRRYLNLLVMGTYSDGVSGWLLLASFFYCHRYYRNVLTITNFILSSCLTPESQLVCSELFPKPQSSSAKLYGSFLKRYRNVCVKGLSIAMIEEGLVFHETDLELISIPGFMYKYGHSTPAVFANFLVFMSFHHLRQYEKRRRALFDLQKSVEDVHQSSPLFPQDVKYFNKALKLANCQFPTSLLPKIYSNLSNE